jgi:hypothetical protein
MNNNDDLKLREVLAAWQVTPPPVPHFKSAVWQRIAAEEARDALGGWRRLREWLVVELPRPAYASTLLAVTVIASFTAANVRANHQREQYRLESARQYLASIDPLAMAANSGMSR